MRIVVDSNILFTFFWKDSTFNKICKRKVLQLITPEFSLEEFNKYKQEIIKKAKISEEEFNNKKLELINMINFISLESYISEFSNIKILAKKFEGKYNEVIKDIDSLALALKLNAPLWTHDKLLKEQDKIKILTTKEIIEII